MPCRARRRSPARAPEHLRNDPQALVMLAHPLVRGRRVGSDGARPRLVVLDPLRAVEDALADVDGIADQLIDRGRRPALATRRRDALPLSADARRRDSRRPRRSARRCSAQLPPSQRRSRRGSQRLDGSPVLVDRYRLRAVAERQPARGEPRSALPRSPRCVSARSLTRYSPPSRPHPSARR